MEIDDKLFEAFQQLNALLTLKYQYKAKLANVDFDVEEITKKIANVESDIEETTKKIAKLKKEMNIKVS